MLHGIEELTVDEANVMRWKGKQIGCYEHAQTPEAAQRIAAQCRHLEAIGVPVIAMNLTWKERWFEDMTADNPYTMFLHNLRDVFIHSDGRTVIGGADVIFYWDCQNWSAYRRPKESHAFEYATLMAAGFEIPDVGQGQTATGGLESLYAAKGSDVCAWLMSQRIPHHLFESSTADASLAPPVLPAHGLHGISELTWDSQGYIYWKGIQVEHYNRPTSEEMIEPAQRLAEQCRHLEAIGVPVSTSTACWKSDWFMEMTADYPYKHFILKLGGIDMHPDGRIVITNLTRTDRTAYYWDKETWHIYRRFPKIEAELWDEDIFEYHPLHWAGFDTPDMGQGRHKEGCIRSLITVPFPNLDEWLRSHNVPPDLFDRPTDTALVAPKLVRDLAVDVMGVPLELKSTYHNQRRPGLTLFEMAEGRNDKAVLTMDVPDQPIMLHQVLIAETPKNKLLLSAMEAAGIAQIAESIVVDETPIFRCNMLVMPYAAPQV